MTKRILLATLAMILTVAVSAQSGGSLWWGFYNGVDVPDNHLGLGKPVVYEAAIHVSGTSAPTAATTITSVRLPFTAVEHVDSLTLWLTTDLESDQRIVTLPVDAPVAGWNEVALPEPVSIPAEGLFVGYTFRVTSIDGDDSERPLVMCDALGDGGLWLRVAAVKGYKEWASIRRYGSLAMQLQLTGGQLAPCSVSADAIRQSNVVRLTDDEVELMLSNYGTEAITSIDYAYSFGSETRNATYTLPAPLQNVYGLQGYLVLPITAPEAT